MPSPRTPSRVTIPCRSSSSSASARRSGSPRKSGAASDQRPCVAVTAAARARENRRTRWSGRGSWKRRAAIDPVPVRQEAAERGLLRRLDLAAQRSQRRTAQPAQHLRVAPLALAAAWTQLAAHELLLALERAQMLLDVAAERVVRLRCRERAAPARVALHELPQRIVRAFEERVRQSRRRHDADRVAIPARVFRSRQGTAEAERPPLADERLGEARVVLELVPAQAQEVVQ